LGWVFGFLGRESIFKFSHTKSRKKFQNLNLEPKSPSKSLQSTRWVYEGGRETRQPGSSSGAPLLCGHRENLLGRDVRLRLGASLGTTAGAWLLQVALGGLSLRLFGRESIFKFSHTKSRKKFQNLDLEPDSTCKSLQASRWVYEGGREAWQVRSSSSLFICTGRYEPLGGDVRLRLGASPGAATAASPPDSDRDALVQTPTVCRRISR